MSLVILFNPQVTSTGIIRRAVGTPVAAAGSVSPVIPASAQVGDLLILHVHSSATSTAVATVASATGWIQRDTASDLGASPGLTITVLYRICQAGDPGSTVTPTYSNTIGTAIAVINVYGNVDTATPFESSSANFEAGAGSTLHVTNSIVTTQATDWILTDFGDKSGSTWTPPSGQTELTDTAGFGTLETNDSNGPVAAGTISATGNGSASTPSAVMWIGAIKAAFSAAAQPAPVKTRRRVFTRTQNRGITAGTVVTATVTIPPSPQPVRTKLRPGRRVKAGSFTQPIVPVTVTVTPIVPAPVKSRRLPAKPKSGQITAGIFVNVPYPDRLRTRPQRKPFIKAKTSGITAGTVVTVTVTPPVVPATVRTIRKPFTRVKTSGITVGTFIPTVTVTVPPVPQTVRTRRQQVKVKAGQITAGISVKIPVPALVKTARMPLTRRKPGGFAPAIVVTVATAPVPPTPATIRTRFRKTAYGDRGSFTAPIIVTVAAVPAPAVPATVRTPRRPLTRISTRGITSGYATIVFPPVPIVPATVKTPRRPFNRTKTAGITRGFIPPVVVVTIPPIPARVSTRIRPFNRTKNSRITAGYATIVVTPQLLIVPKPVKTPRRGITRQDSGGIYPAIVVTITTPVAPIVPDRVRTKLRPFKRVKTSGIATGYKPYAIIIVVPVKTRRPFLRIVRGKISGAQAPGIPVLVFYGQASAGGSEILITAVSQGPSAADTAGTGQAPNTTVSNPDAPKSDVSGRVLGT